MIPCEAFYEMQFTKIRKISTKAWWIINDGLWWNRGLWWQSQNLSADPVSWTIKSNFQGLFVSYVFIGTFYAELWWNIPYFWQFCTLPGGTNVPCMEVPRESSLQFYKLDCLFWKAWIMWGTSNHNSGCIMHQSLNCKGAIQGKIDSSSDQESRWSWNAENHYPSFEGQHNRA